MLDWVMYMPLKKLRFSKEAKVEQITVIVTTHSVSCFVKEVNI